MKHTSRMVALLLMALTLAPVAVSASPVLRSGESVTISDVQGVSNDFYAAGGTVTVAGDVSGDLYATGGTVTVNGNVAEDAVVAGGIVRIQGGVGDDVRIAGGEIIVAGEVGGDLIVLGGILHVLSTARIEGDVLVFGGEANIDGMVRGSVAGRAEAVRINGPVVGNAIVTSTKALELGDQANIEGNVEYRSTWDLIRAPGSVVVGDIVKKDVNVTSTASSFSIVSLLALFFTTLVYMKFARPRIVRFAEHVRISVVRFALVGLGVIFVTPLAAGLLMITMIGLPLGLVLLFTYILTLVVAWSLGGIIVGTFLEKYIDHSNTLTIKWALIGTLVFGLLSYVPVLGTILVLLVMLVACGGIAIRLYARIRQ